MTAYQRENPTFQCHFSIDKTTKPGWNGFTGFVDEDKIGKTIPKDISKAFFAVCGPPPLCNIVEKMLVTKFKVKTSQFYRF